MRQLLPFFMMILATVYIILFLGAESEGAVMGLVAVGVLGGFAASRMGLFTTGTAGPGGSENLMNALAVAGVAAIALFFHNDHFTLLMVAKVLLYVIVCLGMNIQFGYAGIPNFSGAAFFGTGSYAAAVLMMHTPLPPVVNLLLGGGMAALIGSLLILPILRTRGHYAALITIAFSILFKTFLEVNDLLGGPQGLNVKGMSMLGWNFNDNIEIGSFEGSFYLGYVALALVLAILAFSFTRRIERSWIGLNLDAVRLDETASACFGIDIALWKIIAFTLGNFLIGVAGSLSAMMTGFIAPNNFTFSESLILVSIILLGGIGNVWGLVVGSAFVLLLPEKLQLIQEYRFLLFSGTVILILLFRPDGLIPRSLRFYFPVRSTR
ncbi:MAG: branched-chain amino acid ABC transporter permease [Syntrophobacter sp.]